MLYIRVLIISFAIHCLLAVLVSFVPDSQITRPNLKRQSYVDLLESPELQRRPKQAAANEQTFVRSAPAPEKLLTQENKRKRFASEEEQNVIEETKAQANGLTANRAPEASQKAERRRQTAQREPMTAREKMDFTPTSPLERIKKEIMEDEGPNGIRVGGVTKSEAKRTDRRIEGRAQDNQPMQMPSFNGYARGISTLGQDLPNDIKIGSFTALNTDRHLFYSFYARMEEAIRNRWESYVRAALYEFQAGAPKVAAKDRWVTRLEVILDSKGNFEKAMMSEGSGVRSFDAAPVQAFREAAKFPNPPPEMVKEDGKIHIFYAFTIDMIPRYATRGAGDE
jgi:TonB family protein